MRIKNIFQKTKKLSKICFILAFPTVYCSERGLTVRFRAGCRVTTPPPRLPSRKRIIFSALKKLMSFHSAHQLFSYLLLYYLGYQRADLLDDTLDGVAFFEAFGGIKACADTRGSAGCDNVAGLQGHTA